MQPDTLKHLIDILDAATDIQTFIHQYDLTAYRADAKCRAAVERKLEIIGEACTRIRNNDPDALDTLPYAQQVIGLRNRVIHAYDNIDDAIIWDVVSSKLASFVSSVETLARS
jgi:uncharacterized protein with HEPN domain